ncbi:MAG: 2-oxo acid dehydrogenase subunit E2, partial [Candidatus Thermoplasmatota archaeon]
TIAALKEHPTLNASVDDERQEIVIKHSFNMGIATATEEGLTVAVIHDADRLGLWDLGKEVDRLATAARDKKLTLNDVQGSTFTITSLGKEGGILATPIINWPEVAILGVHKIEKRPVVRDDHIVIREMMYLSCSFDHRVIDGHVGAAFVQSVKNYLEHPAMLFVGLE